MSSEGSGFSLTGRAKHSSLSCGEVINELSAYIDGDAGPRLSAEIEVHLNCCQRCKTVLTTILKMLALMGDEKSILAALDSFDP